MLTTFRFLFLLAMALMMVRPVVAQPSGPDGNLPMPAPELQRRMLGASRIMSYHDISSTGRPRVYRHRRVGTTAPVHRDAPERQGGVKERPRRDSRPFGSGPPR